MSAKPSREAQKQATRAGLKRAARGCFTKLGYGATGIGDIAKAAGVAHGTLYVHYAGKDAVMDELLADYTAALADKLSPVMATATTKPFEHTIRGAAEAVLDDWKKNKKLIRCFAERAGAGLGADSLHAGVNPPAVALVTPALAAVAEARGVDDVPWDLVTHGLLAMWLRVGLRYLWIGTRARAVDTLVRMTVGAIEPLLNEGES